MEQPTYVWICKCQEEAIKEEKLYYLWWGHGDSPEEAGGCRSPGCSTCSSAGGQQLNLWTSKFCTLLRQPLQNRPSTAAVGTQTRAIGFYVHLQSLQKSDLSHRNSAYWSGSLWEYIHGFKTNITGIKRIQYIILTCVLTKNLKSQTDDFWSRWCNYTEKWASPQNCEIKHQRTSDKTVLRHWRMKEINLI